MGSARPRSKKVRALQIVLGRTPAEIARECGAAPLSYRETAADWERQVRHVFPDLEIRFTYTDVYRLIKRYGT